MNDLFRKSALPIMLLALAGCATQGKPPPTISLDEPVQAQPLPEAPKPVEVVSVPQVLPMPAQMTAPICSVSAPFSVIAMGSGTSFGQSIGPTLMLDANRLPAPMIVPTGSRVLCCSNVPRG